MITQEIWYVAVMPCVSLKLHELYLQKEIINAGKILDSSKESKYYHFYTIKSELFMLLSIKH